MVLASRQNRCSLNIQPHQPKTGNILEEDTKEDIEASTQITNADPSKSMRVTLKSATEDLMEKVRHSTAAKKNTLQDARDALEQVDIVRRLLDDTVSREDGLNEEIIGASFPVRKVLCSGDFVDQTADYQLDYWTAGLRQLLDSAAVADARQNATRMRDRVRQRDRAIAAIGGRR